MTSGYSGTPLPKKLGIGPDSRVQFVRAPESFVAEVGLDTNAADDLDVVVVFCLTLKDLEEAFALKTAIKKAGAIWIAWPKKASKIPTEITEDTLRDVGLPLGLVDNKVCAIDEKWSGLRFVWRKELR